VVAATDIPVARMPDWEDYRADFLAGVPLLSSTNAGVDFEPGERIAATLAEQLAAGVTSAGLLRYLSWTVMARYLSPVITAFAGWRDEERWLRRQCPTCGSLPAMAQLVGADPGRKRLLVCGCCHTRWQFARTGCPFCETNAQRLASVTVAGESGLRIDHCESCHGYLKTYDGEGNEALLLSDWSSLHLDLLAHDRGLKKLAASLYEFEPAPVLARP
jgi:FdhE protein